MPIKNKLIVILGPTASGKTDWSIKLSRRFNGEIVSADSRQIYKEMDIGTAKPKRESRIKNQELRIKEKYFLVKEVPHYLIDVVRPDEEFTLAQYKKEAVKIIKNIQKRGKFPFLVGGTGLYIQAVVDNLTIPEVKPNLKIRKKLEQKNEQELFEELLQKDPGAGKFIDPHNKRRIIRALEVCLITKKPFSAQRKSDDPIFETLQIGINLNKEALREKINQRADIMIKKGLVDEVKALLKKYSPSLPAMSGIGYKEIVAYLNNEISLEEAKAAINQNTWRYSRRQMSWFRRDKRIHWTDEYKEARKMVKEFVGK